MQHRYIFYTGSELIVATIEVDGPLPHLKEGAVLNLTCDDYSQIQGSFLKINRVEVVMTYLDSKIVRNDIHLFCSEQERTQ